jgi:hypothetical protein
MRGFVPHILSAALLATVSLPAQAGSFFGDDGPTLVWVTIRALPGESGWQACRRVYQRDVYVIGSRHGNRQRCRVDHSRIYQPGERRQNFNQ